VRAGRRHQPFILNNRPPLSETVASIILRTVAPARAREGAVTQRTALEASRPLPALRSEVRGREAVEAPTSEVGRHWTLHSRRLEPSLSGLP
jgi:hypothetical protein